MHISTSEIKIPTHICDVNIPKGWGNGGGTQFDTMGKFIDEDAFVNERLIDE